MCILELTYIQTNYGVFLYTADEPSSSMCFRFDTILKLINWLFTNNEKY